MRQMRFSKPVSSEQVHFLRSKGLSQLSAVNQFKKTGDYRWIESDGFGWYACAGPAGEGWRSVYFEDPISAFVHAELENWGAP